MTCLVFSERFQCKPNTVLDRSAAIHVHYKLLMHYSHCLSGTCILHMMISNGDRISGACVRISRK